MLQMHNPLHQIIVYIIYVVISTITIGNYLIVPQAKSL